MRFDDSCIFCKIVQRKAPANIIFEDNEILGFLDIRPVNEGHALVIPKEHFVDVYEIPAELLGRVYQVTQKLTIAIKQAVKADGISIIQQNGRAANQDIFHLHVHIIPRYLGQGNAPFHELKIIDNLHLEKTAMKIKPFLEC